MCIDCLLGVAEVSAKIRCGIVVFTDLGFQTQQHLMKEAPGRARLNGFYRYKTIIGRTLRARGDEAREGEAILGCKILNRCLEMGRPDSVRIG